MFNFLADFFAGATEETAAAFARFVGSDDYGLVELRDDLAAWSKRLGALKVTLR